MIRDVREPLRLTVDRWLARDEEEAALVFETYPSLSMGEMTLTWGPGVRQTRTYALQEPDLIELHTWLRKVLGYDDD